MGEEIKDAEEQQTIENIQEVFKRKAYLVGNELLKHAQTFNQYVHYFLVIVESLQILWFSIHPSFEFLSSVRGMSQLQTGLSYIHLEHVMTVVPGSWSLLMLICVFVVALHVGSLLTTISLTIRKSSAANLFARITSIQIFVFNTILVGPVVNVISVTLYCDPKSQYHLNEICYNVGYIIYCVFASIIALCILVEVILFVTLYFSRNPFSNNCIAAPQNLVALAKFLLKVLPCIYFVIDSSSKYRIIYVFSFPALMLGYLYFFRIYSRHHFNERHFYFVYCCEIVITWFSIINIMHFYLTTPDKPNLCLIYTIISCFPLCYTLVKLEQSSKNQIFLQGIRNVKKNKQIAQEFLQQVISLVETYKDGDNRTKLLAFMKIHSSCCQKDSGCICHQFLRDFYQKKKLTQEEERQQMYVFLKFLMLDNIKKYPSMIIFKLSYAYLLYFRLNSKVQGVYVATQASKEKLSFSEEFMVYRIKIQFQQEMQHTEQEANVQKGHSIRVYLQFNKQLLNLEQEIQSCAEDSLQYWCQLTEDSPSVLKLWNMAKRCELKAKSAQKYFNKIMEIYPNNLKSLLLYSNFLKEIVLNIKQYEKLQERIKGQKITNNNAKDSSTDMKFRENSNLCIVTISTLSGNMGSIVNCNSQMQGLLHYGKGQIVGQKISKIMPKVYHEVHDGFLTKYISKPDAEIVSKEITIFPINKNGYICECVLFVKLLPNFQDGFHLAGFLRKLDHCADTFYLMYDSSSLEVQEISENCLRLGFIEDYMQKSHNAHTITMNYLFPQFHFEQASPEIFKNQGYQTVIDLRIVSDEYEDELQESAQVNVSMLKKVHIYLVQEATYNSKTRIKIIKFILKMEGQLLQNQERPRARLGTNCSQMDRRLVDQKYRKRDEVSAEEDEIKDEETINYKKFTTFVSQKRTKIMLALLIISAYIFLAFQIVLVSTDLSNNVNDSSEVLTALKHINNTQSMPLYISKIVFTSKKLLMMNRLQLNMSQFEKYRLELNKTLTTTQQTMVQLIRQDIIMSEMGYSPPKLQSFLSFQNNNVTLSQESEYNDGMFQLITTGLYISNMSYEVFNDQNVKIEEISFIRLNGLTTFLSLANNKIQSIGGYFDNRFETYVQTRKIMLCLRVVSIVLVFLIIFPIIIKLDHTNEKLLGIYRALPLTDIRQVQGKCQGFLYEHFEEVAQKYKTRTDAIEQMSKKHIEKADELPLLSNLKESQEEEECLQKKVPKVRLGNIPKSKEQILFLLFFTLLMLGNFFAQYVLYYKFFEPLRKYERDLLDFGQVRNTNRLVIMFSQEYLCDGTYKQQLQKSMSDLYWKMENLYSKVPERNRVRERIYGKIEEIRGLMLNQSFSQLMTPIYVDAQKTLLNAEMTLNNEINSFVTEWQSDIRDTFRRSFNIKFAIEFICVLLFIKILISGYLQRLITKTKRSINMAMMIPPDIIGKNKDLFTLL